MAKPYTHLLNALKLLSDVEQVSGGSLTIDLEVEETYRHCFAGIEFYSDANGNTSVLPSAGSITFSIRTANQPNGFQTFPSNVVDPTAPDQVNWAANTQLVRAVITGITGATHARMIATCNVS